MNDNSLKHNRFILFGVLLSIFIFAFHFFFIEKPISDHRLTLSVSSEEYNTYLSTIGDYKHKDVSKSFFMSPNFQSIADTLIDDGIRRFELKMSTPNQLNIEESCTIYFYNYNIDTPSLIGNSNFGASTPLQKSLGYSILFLCIIILIDLTFFNKGRGKQ